MTVREPSRPQLTERHWALAQQRLREAGLVADGLGPINPSGRPGPYPLSFAQQRLWFLEQLSPGNPFYNVQANIRHRGVLYSEVVRRAVNVIVERHEVLRTVFRVVGGEPKQVVLPRLEIDLPIVDLRRVPPAEREREAVRLAIEEQQRSYDLATGPLVRTRLVRLGEHDHVFLIGFHHVVADGWSMGVFERELGEAYEAVVGGGEPSRTPLAVQYADFAVWQREWLAGERLAGALGYWRQRLGGLVPLGLPTDRPRPGVQLHRGAGFGFAVEPAVVEGLGRVARQSGATLFMVLLAGFVVAVGRWCAQDDVVVGAPMAGRDRAELEGLIGFFVNTLVLRVDVSGDPSFVELVGRVREVALGAYGHAEVPFEKLVEELAPERDLSRNPLFQVTFQLFESPSAPGAVGPGAGLEIPVTSSLFDVRVDLSPAPSGGLAGRVEFDTELFERSSIEWLVQRLVWVWERAAAEPEARVGTWWLVPPSQAALVAGWNATDVGLVPVPVHRLVEARVAEDPERPAVGDDGGTWSYGELNRRANALAWWLVDAGRGRGDVVAVWLPRGRDFVAATLGVLKAGAMYLPLDGSYPAGRVAQVIGDAAPAVVVTTREWAARVGVPAGTAVVTVEAWPNGPDADPDVAVVPGDGAYVIYTSGSTGTPKGVVVEHASLVNLVGWHTRTYGVQGRSRGSQIASVGFDAAVWELWPYLCAGASVWVADDDTRADADGLIEWLADREITVSFVPTPLAEMLLERPWPARARLQYLLTGGDTLRRGANPAHPYTLVNHYGPTESTVVTTATVVGLDPGRGRLPPIGAPIDNTVCYVVDHAGCPAGPGVPGELWIGGTGVARGYLGDPGLSATRFVDNPFAPTPPRLYRTGDLVRWNAEGTLGFLGRLDHQIKIRGYRIEPGELETLLTTHPHITHAVVTTHPHPATQAPQLTAYVTTATNQEDQRRQVDAWRRLYDDTYGGDAPGSDDDPEFDIRGWNNSYDGTPLGPEVMREQVEQTVGRVAALRPEAVLEIGCGSGLLLYRLAEGCRRYVATDFSRAALDRVRARAVQHGWHHVQLLERDARDLAGLDDAGPFDVVLLNSVVQYFPDVAYLEAMLDGALALVRPGGHIFVGDVRNHALLEAFHTSVELERAAADLSIAELHRRVRSRMAAEQELLVDPAWFAHFAGGRDRVTAVEAWPRRGRLDTELARFRYDVVLTLDGAEPSQASATVDWLGDRLDLATVAALATDLCDPIVVAGVPSRRLERWVRAAGAVAADDDGGRVARLRADLDAATLEGVDPEALWALAGPDLAVDVSWHGGGSTGRYDVALRRPDTPPVALCRVASTERPLSNDPSRHGSRLAGEIKEWLRERVPEQMVPHAIVPLDAMPLTAHGKIDLSALPVPAFASTTGPAANGDAAPSDIARRLAAVWAEVLAVSAVGTDDNFFELGGDSILSIKLVSRAAEAGLFFSAKHLFQNQTVGELAEVVSTTRMVEAEQGPVVGEVLLTPVQRWFFEQAYAEPHHFNQAALIPVARTANLKLLVRAIRAVLAHHDVLHHRFERRDGDWHQYGTPPSGELEITSADLSRVAPDALSAALDRAGTRLQASLSIAGGSLVRVGLFDLGPLQSWRLLIAVHHLVVDGVSWRILMEDIWSAYAQLTEGLPVRLPPKTTSFKEWARHLTAHAARPGVTEQVAFWRQQLATDRPPLPRDLPGDDNTVGASRTVRVQLDASQTDAMLHSLLAERGVEINDVLISSLAHGLREWTGADEISLAVEGHGREPLFDDVDVSRTVGWFTSIFPVRLHLGDPSPLATLAAVADQLHRIPDHGIGYGILRYLAPDDEVRRSLGRPPWPEVVFNYLGQLDTGVGPGDPLRERRGHDRSPAATRSYLVEVNAAVIDGRLQCDLYYSPAMHHEATIQRVGDGFIDRIRDIVQTSRSHVDVRAMTSERVSSDDVERLLSELRGGSADE